MESENDIMGETYALAGKKTVILCLFIGFFHPSLGLPALLAYLTAGLFVPLVTSKAGGGIGMKFCMDSGNLSGFVTACGDFPCILSQGLLSSPHLKIHFPYCKSSGYPL